MSYGVHAKRGPLSIPGQTHVIQGGHQIYDIILGNELFQINDRLVGKCSFGFTPCHGNLHYKEAWDDCSVVGSSEGVEDRADVFLIDCIYMCLCELFPNIRTVRCQDSSNISKYFYPMVLGFSPLFVSWME